MFNKFDSFTFFPAQSWTHTWERQHEIILRFAQIIENNMQIYNPFGLIEYNLFSYELLKKIHQKMIKKKQAENIERKLECMKFVNVPYIHKFDRLSTKINYASLRYKSNISDHNFFWSTYISPLLYEVFKRSTFRIIDLAERRQKNPKLSDAMKELEKKSVSEADLVIVDNYATLNDYQKVAKNIQYIPQGYDNQKIHFQKNKTKSKTIGYLGNLHSHIDYEYLFRLIELNMDYEFLILGQILDERALHLHHFKNVKMIGQVPKDAIGDYLYQMDFGLIPYLINEYSEGIFPTKLFEYLGAGVPVISTPLPEIIQYQNDKYVFIMEHPKAVIYETDFSGVSELLERNTWESRFDHYIKCLGEAMV